MERPNIRNTKVTPEDLVVKKVKDYLVAKGWYVKVIIGCTFQSGLPDFYVTHQRYGGRWLELKDPNRRGDLFTPAQREVFPTLISHGSPVLVLSDINDEIYQSIILPNRSNYFRFLMDYKPRH